MTNTAAQIPSCTRTGSLVSIGYRSLVSGRAEMAAAHRSSIPSYTEHAASSGLDAEQQQPQLISPMSRPRNDSVSRWLQVGDVRTAAMSRRNLVSWHLGSTPTSQTLTRRGCWYETTMALLHTQVSTSTTYGTDSEVPLPRTSPSDTICTYPNRHFY